MGKGPGTGGRGDKTSRGTRAVESETKGDILDRAIRAGKDEIKLSDIFNTQTDEDTQATINYAVAPKVNWNKAKVEDISTKELHSVQDVVFTDILKQYRDNPSDEKITVIQVGGANYVVDGNHRAAAAILRGEKTIKATVAKFYTAEVTAIRQRIMSDENFLMEVVTGSANYKITQKR